MPAEPTCCTTNLISDRLRRVSRLRIRIRVHAEDSVRGGDPVKERNNAAPNARCKRSPSRKAMAAEPESRSVRLPRHRGGSRPGDMVVVVEAPRASLTQR